MSLAGVLNAVFSISLLILSILLSIYHIISTAKHTEKWCTREQIKSDPSILLSYVLVFVAVISGISLTLDSVLTSAFCPFAQYYGPTLYALFKSIVYLILGCRIWIAFKNSIYEYDARKLIIWAIFISLWTLFNIILTNFTVTSSIESKNGDTKCIVTPSFFYIISQALLDLVASIVNCILFVKPICKLHSLAVTVKSGKDLRFKMVAYKQSYLSMIAILSSMISLVGIGIFGDIVPVFVTTDMWLSTVCVILMYKWNYKITNALFCCCIQTQAATRERNSIQSVTQTETANTCA